jgi:hypothetical protein
MFGSEILDVAAGIIFVFLLVSLIATAIREGIESWLKTRATHLQAGIRELLYDPSGSGVTKKLFEHPLIYSLYPGQYSSRETKKWPIALTRGCNMPSYIPSRNFALALIDMAARGPIDAANESQLASTPISLQTLRANLSLIQNPPVQRVLLNAIDNAEGDLQKVQANIEAWYNSAMERVSGWYKRSTQWILLGIGLVIGIALNVNAITIGDHLYRNKAARETLVARAQSSSLDANYPSRKYPDIQKELDSLSLPIGGTDQFKDIKRDPYRTFSGWILTAIAASLGAPFWFDLLNKIMVLRSTVKPHQKSPEQSSDHRKTDAGSPNLPQTPAMSSGTAQSRAGSTATLATTDLMDGCDVQVTSVARDEELPVAEGGVR